MTPVLSWKRKFDGSSKGPWEGQFIEEQGGWAIVYYPRIPASQLTGGGAKPASGIRYHGLRYPLSILVYFDAQGVLRRPGLPHGVLLRRRASRHPIRRHAGVR